MYVVLKIHVVFMWAMTLCRLVDDYPYFRGTYYFHVHSCPEYGGNVFLHNIAIHVPEYTVF